VIRRAVLLLVTAVALAGCSQDPQDRYCDAVSDHQAGLSDLLSSGGNDALIQALPAFEDLSGKAPQDLRDEWRTVVGAVTELRDALEAAGADPATYDRSDPPAGVTRAQREAIDAAARQLSSERTVRALEGVQQQARDVCGTPLTV
jgi:hypothetical protein